MSCFKSVLLFGVNHFATSFVYGGLLDTVKNRIGIYSGFMQWDVLVPGLQNIHQHTIQGTTRSINNLDWTVFTLVEPRRGREVVIYLTRCRYFVISVTMKEWSAEQQMFTYDAYKKW